MYALDPPRAVSKFTCKLKLPQTIRTIFKGDNFHNTRFPQFRQFFYLPCELGFSDRFPSVFSATDSVESKNMPATWFYPCADDLSRSHNLTTIHSEPVNRARRSIIRLLGPYPCLLVPCLYRGLFEMLNSPIERVAEGWNFRLHPSLYPSLGFRRFKSGVCHDELPFMTNCMTANFVPPLDHAFEKLDVVCIPRNLAPLETPIFHKSVSEYGISIGDQEKCARKTIFVEDRDGLFKRASQSVVECKGDKCWFVHKGNRHSLKTAGEDKANL
jgi:hypothetical protein